MLVEAKRLAAISADGAEDAPAVDDAGLPRRQPGLFDQEELIVMDDERMHGWLYCTRAGQWR